ncbi:TAXI family TRAP transporter solute-binding subunit [Symbioplanes lichenis]|uniref:TAXI family TRAP transporter solute-binding subunit n=1 Tax=Symbioplanes lichenis TaxID=1629072 RepID=UPI0027381B27|nr:TAXI family TRAP transporter solute-binding subunit [Actinoplanes lichenis]
MRRRSLLAGFALPFLAACTGEEPERRRVRIATGSPTGVYHAVGTALAGLVRRELPGTETTVLATAASAENVRLVTSGGAEVGFTQADILTGDQPSALARVYDDLLHLVVRADSPVTALGDLRGRRVSVGARGSGTVVTVDRLLAVARMAGTGQIQRRELSLDDSLAALGARDIDAFFFSGGLPVTGVQRLGSDAPIRIIGLAGWAPALRQTYTGVYEVRDVPASVYHVPAVATIAVPNLLVVPASLPESTAFDLTRLLLERRDVLAAAHPAAERLDIRSAIATSPVPLHPGAARYYRSVKA